MRKMVEASRRGGGGAGKRPVVQVGLNWAPTEGEALAGAHEQWRFNALGGEVNWQLRTPEELDATTRFVRPEDMREAAWISSDPGWHAEQLEELAELGFDEIQLHRSAATSAPSWKRPGSGCCRRCGGGAAGRGPAPGDRTFS